MKILPQAGVALLCMTWVVSGFGQSINLRGTITDRDLHAYKLVPFEVPAGTHRLTVAFSYTGRDQKTVLDIGIFDPQRFRGWSGGDKSEFTISDVDATPSYLPGPLVPGMWQLLIGVPNIRKGVTTEYSANVSFSKALDSATPIVLQNGPAWFQGDLHSHTGQSDGSCNSVRGRSVPCPVFKLAESAEQQKLDFLAITDHNAQSTYNHLRELQPYYDNLLLIRGREVTTYEGHMNAFGTAEFIDFRLGATIPTLNDLIREAHSHGALVSINHPAAPSGEICMGCGWINSATTDFSQIDAIEVINGPEAETRFSGIPFWEARLNEGHRITAIGGSDDHNSCTRKDRCVGTPATVVYASELSEAAILEGIRRGHVFVKAASSSDPQVEFTAVAGNQSAMMGDTINAARGEKVSFSARVKSPNPVKVEVIADGKAITDENAGATATEFTLESDGRRHWYRLNVRATDGKLLALTNPIYINFSK